MKQVPFVILLVVLSSSVFAATPESDFVAWYADWLQQARQRSVSAKFIEFQNKHEGKPSVLESTYYSGGPEHQLRTSRNPQFEMQYRSLLNEKYVAQIEAPLDEVPKWSLRKFAFRSDDTFEDSVAEILDTGVPIEFIGRMHGWPKDAEPMKREVEGKIELKYKVEGEFPGETTITLDPESGMPVGLIGGANGWRSRIAIKGWRKHGDFLAPESATSYAQHDEMQKTEAKYATTTYNFDAGELHSNDECYLSHYGLTEPTEPSNMRWWVSSAILAAVFVSGYVLFRRSKR